MNRKNYRPEPRKPDHVEVFHPEADAELLPYLLQVLAPRSHTAVKRIMQRQHVQVNGKTVTQYNAPLRVGDELVVNFTRPFVTFQNRMVNLLYEDDDLLVIEKKSGLLSVAARGNDEYTAQGIVERYIRAKYGYGHAYIVHRLDQYTSGILIFAKRPEVQGLLRDAWATYVIERRYMAVVEGCPEPAEDEIRSYLMENDAMFVRSTRIPEEGKLAVTRYRVVRSAGGYSLVDVLILTGRKNQIRVHLSERGCPVAGDFKYRAQTNPWGRLMLHNSVLQFVHPISRRRMRFELPMPKVFEI